MRSNGETNGSDEQGAWWSRFEDLLDDQTEWPTMYTFKFIAPRPGLDELKDLFGDHPVKVRESSKGNYVSVTAHVEMESSEAVISVYDAASGVDGVIAL